jgi:hypothetical protein
VRELLAYMTGKQARLSEQQHRELIAKLDQLLDSPLFQANGPLHESARDWDEAEYFPRHIHGGKFTGDTLYNPTPPQRVPSTLVREHKHCLRNYYGKTHQFPGDVRRCPHGHVQVLTDPRGGLAGPGTWYWRDLSKWWDPWLYRRAVKVLDANG